jgi:glycosyltransferase involved in cell wall biosynthesis
LLDGGSWVTWHKPSPWDRAKAALKITGRLLPAARTIRGWGCDAVYSNSLTVCSGALVARLLDLPHIWHLHEFGKEDHGVFYKFGEGFSNRSIGKLSSTCIVVSKAMAVKYGRSIPSSKLNPIYPSMHRGLIPGDSVTGDPAPPPATGRFRLVVVGGIVEGKGQAVAVRALAHLVQQNIDAELFIVGEGYLPYLNTVEEIIRATATGERVHLVGRVRDAAPFLRSADLVLVCSRSEAFGRVTIEAMFAGKPVVGAAAGATIELIQDGVNGLHYRCGDAADLASKIQFLKDHPALLRKLGENGRRWTASHFTKERYGEELMAVIRSVVPVPVDTAITVPAAR